MTTQQALQKLAEYEKTNAALGYASMVVYYDGATAAPKKSDDIRAESLGYLAGKGYELTTCPETVEMLETLNADIKNLDAVTARKVSELYRNYDRTRRIPADEFVEFQMLTAKADAVWHDAKEKNDFSLFEPYLTRIFDGVKKIAGYTDPGKPTYDALLGNFERGLTTAQCDGFFATLRSRLVPLIKEISGVKQIDDTPLKQNFPVAVQRDFSDFVMGIMGIDRERCIIGETEHPFTTGLTKNDVRITTHYHEDMVASSLYSVIHEGGHALYELNIGDDITASSLGGGVSMAIHESQSRFYENIIGRSREFCGVILPWLKERFAPRLDGVTTDGFYKMINKSEPSLIRTEADELTYCLHIMVRYELEKAVLGGDIAVKDLPGEWNRLYKEYLGIDVPDDRRGVLQDSHWSNANIGYFPSYAIGSAYGAQYLVEMNKTVDVFGAVASGDLSPVNDWFREKIWKFGCMYDPDKLFASVCGEFDPNVYADYLNDKFGDIYNI